MNWLLKLLKKIFRFRLHKKSKLISLSSSTIRDYSHLEERALKGIPNGAPVFGYRTYQVEKGLRAYTFHRSNASIIRNAFMIMKKEKVSVPRLQKTLAKTYGEENVPPSDSLRGQLTNPIYAGYFRRHEKLYKSDPFYIPTLIEVKDWNEVQFILSMRSKGGTFYKIDANKIKLIKI